MLTTIRGGFTQFIPAAPTAYAKELHKMFTPSYCEDEGKPVPGTTKVKILKCKEGTSPFG
jgi:hypothetical protein